MTTAKMLLAVLVMALVTYIPRVAPLLFVRGKIQWRFLRSFLYYIPYAVLAAMTFPAIFACTGNIYTALCGLAGALLVAYFDLGLLLTAIISVLCVFGAQILF